MKFTNISCRDLYFQCCHREVAPGESFSVPWLAAQRNRAVRAAMADKVLGWASEGDEPEVPGSPHVPTPGERAKVAKLKAEAAKARREAEEKARRRRMAEDEAGMKANMARMGDFKVPGPVPLRAPAREGARERPVTSADIISGRSPRSLADVMRHNRAVRQLGTDGTGGAGGAGGAGGTGGAGGAGKAGKGK